MATLFRERDARARRSRNTQLAFYRHELSRSADQRGQGLASVDAAGQRIRQLLPGALQAGLPVGEVAALTGVSRATLYRMLVESRQRNGLQSLVGDFERVLALLDEDMDVPPLPADLQRYLGIPLDEVFDKLMQLYQPLAAEADALGPLGLTLLGDLIPQLGTPEKIVLNMLLFQGLPAAEVGRSTQLSEVRVLGWAALGLLRLLPELRANQKASLAKHNAR
ncbi:MAG TPA: hypothetical protein VK707_01535 [Solirubrobacteraceae bacterium]|nr:hypothetical protein [Solirubrobacteraceae bacterium]